MADASGIAGILERRETAEMTGDTESEEKVEYTTMFEPPGAEKAEESAEDARDEEPAEIMDSAQSAGAARSVQAAQSKKIDEPTQSPDTETLADIHPQHSSQSPVCTTTFSYDDPNWKDKLTAVNGIPITYDAIGNPLNDGTWNYVWQHGRQLKSMTRGTENTAGYRKLDFQYNEDGLRVQKKATEYNAITGQNTVTTTDYILHGKNIQHMFVTADGTEICSLHFYYNAQNRPSIVEIMQNGTTTAFAYLYNLQNDVIALVDASGNTVVKYRYDAWGKLLSITGSLADSLGRHNPFRYRGYVYDEETGLYYLRSRYYHPELARFLSSDQEIEKDDLLSCNSFCYCLNNPITRRDNTGKASYAIGTDFSCSAGGTVSYASGYCWDDQGNFGAYYTVTGMSPDMLNQPDVSDMGFGGFGLSAALTYQYYPSKSIKEIAGKGSYVGIGGGTLGYGLSIDAINTLERKESFADTVRSNRPPDGYQYSLSAGLGIDMVHIGEATTYIALIFEQGHYVPGKKRKWAKEFK